MITRAEQQAAFESIYKNLNQAQKQAVDTIEGPVMVIAGPGTGKTQILGARIGKILLETDTAPENILCLTYTDAGAIAMRKRLVSFIGTSAYKVNISTFHSFCNDIIQDNLSLFDKTSLDPISELEKIELLKKLIDGFEKNNPLKRYRGDVYFEMSNLAKLFSAMKKEGWTSSYLIEKINTYIQEIPFREEFIYKRKYKQFEAGSLKQGLVDIEMEKMEKLKAAVASFDVYQSLMKSHNRYDFDDMINWVLNAFNENKNLLAQYQERYLYILVDEFQDTSGTQNALIKLLVNYWEQPNLFVVGDDDQSIYAFRGADISNILGFESKFPAAKIVKLEENYRSISPILDLANNVIKENKQRRDKTLWSQKKSDYKPLLWAMADTDHEAAVVVEDIVTHQSKGGHLGDIAILYRSNTQGPPIEDQLRLSQVPYNIIGGQKFYDKRKYPYTITKMNL